MNSDRRASILHARAAPSVHDQTYGPTVSKNEDTRPPWEPGGSVQQTESAEHQKVNDETFVSPTNEQVKNETQPADTSGVQQEERQHDNPPGVDIEQASANSPTQLPHAAQDRPGQQTKWPQVGPDGEGEYDDLSGGPPAPIP